MQTCVQSAVIQGMEVLPIRVEVDVMRGLPGFYVVGLPGSSIREARERVRSSFVACGKDYPMQRLVINLVPGNLPKQSTHFDLPIAVGLLVATGQIQTQVLEETLFVGELSLQGAVEPVQGVFLLAEYAAKAGFTSLCMPSTNISEALLIPEIQTIAVSHLRDVCTYLQSGKRPKLSSQKHVNTSALLPSSQTLFDHILGQEAAKRAMVIASAGGHNILLSGPPGCGKTMLAKSAIDILPNLSSKEFREVLRIYSAAGKVDVCGSTRPFRAVHHTTTRMSLVGGGARRPLPGEITLAHRGVLLLDELPEFSREHIEMLREPLEERTVTLRRQDVSLRFPAACMVVGTMNPCPCGFYGVTGKACLCTDTSRERYYKKISGPIRDRFDLHVQLDPHLGAGQTDGISDMSPPPSPEGTLISLEEAREQVSDARHLQRKRGLDYGIETNSDIPAALLEQLCNVAPHCKDILSRIISKHQLSMRARSRLMKVARTIADIQKSSLVEEVHLFEALYYRQSL